MTPKNKQFRPKSVPKNFLGRKLNIKVAVRNDAVRKDGRANIYFDLSLNGRRKKIYLGIFIKPENFLKEKQRVSSREKNSKDINLLIERELSKIYAIELEYRLKNKHLDIDTLIKEYRNPSDHIDFIRFYEKELNKQKGVLKKGTYRQQKSTLNFLKRWKGQILFHEINKDLINELIAIQKNKLKNSDAVVWTMLKNIKKYLHIANDQGIHTELTYNQIKVKPTNSNRTFLSKEEIRQLYAYYISGFIPESHKNVLGRFLFSVFTGLRISDVQKLTRKNIHDGVIFVAAEKTGKIQQIPLNESAKKFIDLEDANLFKGKYTDQHINRILKEIQRVLKIRKKLTFHVARHTFATQWLLNGGDVVNLKEALGHSSIRETMIYVHLVQSVTEKQFNLLDKLLE